MQTAAHDLGTGAYTAIALTAADGLGVTVRNVTVELGRSDLPPAPAAGGSNTTASGISAALHEATEIDRRAARYTNKDLAEYMIPVNADVEEVKVIFVPELDDQINPLGIKGLGELGNVGVNAAIANAVYHATGIRVRELPIRLEKLMA